MVIGEWRSRCQPFGVEVLYKCGGKLVDERTRRPSSMVVTECHFADDAAVVGETRESIEKAIHALYFGSILESHEEILMDVEDRVASVSRAFGVLCRPGVS